MQFDWFQTTVVEPADRFLAWADVAYSDCEKSDGKGRNSYLHSRTYAQEGIKLLHIAHGGPNGWPNATATSGAAPRFAEAVRKEYPMQGQIRVTRVDSCQDFEGPDCFDTIHSVLKGVALGRGIQTRHEGDWDRAERGRSYYLAAKQSAFQMVGYEKGIQMAEQIAASGGPPRPNLVRLEARFWPSNIDAKVAASTFNPEQVFGCSPWARAIYRLLFDKDIGRIKVSDYRVSDSILSRFAMVRQYRRAVADMIAEADHDEASVGKSLMDLFDSIERENIK